MSLCLWKLYHFCLTNEKGFINFWTFLKLKYFFKIVDYNNIIN